MNKIGFFGGCFNPPTKAHIGLAKLVLEKFNLDKVFFVPMNDFYNKSGLISGNHRLNMLKLLTKDEENIDIADFELKSNKRMYAIDAFEFIEKNFDCKKFFIMGSDNYIKMKNWKDSYKLDKFDYIILDRFNKIEPKENIKLVSNNKFSGISSSIVRNLISEGKNVQDYITLDIYKYIKSNKLYIKED